MSNRLEIAPRSGVAFTMRGGETLTVWDPQGEQVSDMVAFAQDDPREALSNGRTFDYEETIRLSGALRPARRARLAPAPAIGPAMAASALRNMAR